MTPSELGGGGTGRLGWEWSTRAAQAWDSNSPQCVLLARWALASPRKETRRACVWVGLSQELFTFVILESETRTFLPRNVFN